MLILEKKCVLSKVLSWVLCIGELNFIQYLVKLFSALVFTEFFDFIKNHLFFTHIHGTVAELKITYILCVSKTRWCDIQILKVACVLMVKRLAITNIMIKSYCGGQP